MLEIYRVTEQAGIDYMLEHLVADDDETMSELVQIIKDGLEHEPNRTLILHAYDVQEGKEPVLEAFIVACAPVAGEYTFITQAWKILEPHDKSVMDRLFFRLEYWSDSMGKSEIRGETTRKTEPFLRRWDFEHYSSVLRYKIPKDFELRERGTKNGTSDNPSTKQSKGKEKDISRPVERARNDTNGSGSITPAPDPKPAPATG